MVVDQEAPKQVGGLQDLIQSTQLFEVPQVRRQTLPVPQQVQPQPQ